MGSRNFDLTRLHFAGNNRGSRALRRQASSPPSLQEVETRIANPLRQWTWWMTAVRLPLCTIKLALLPPTVQPQPALPCILTHGWHGILVHN